MGCATCQHLMHTATCCLLGTPLGAAATAWGNQLCRLGTGSILPGPNVEMGACGKLTGTRRAPPLMGNTAYDWLQGVPSMGNCLDAVPIYPHHAWVTNSIWGPGTPRSPLLCSPSKPLPGAGRFPISRYLHV